MEYDNDFDQQPVEQVEVAPKKKFKSKTKREDPHQCESLAELGVVRYLVWRKPKLIQLCVHPAL